MISHKRWPLLHYLGFKRQLGEFLGQLPQLKASMNSPPLRTQITVCHKVTKEGHEDDFLKAEQEQKFGKLRLLTAKPEASGGCLFNFCSFVTRELNFCELRIIAVTSLGHQKLVTQVPDTITITPAESSPLALVRRLSASLSRFRLQMAGWHPAPATQNTLWQQRSQALFPNWIQSSIQIFTWQEWSFNRLD